MGWMHTQGATRQSLIKELTSPAVSSTYTPVAHSARGSELWVLFEHKETKVKSIALFLLRGDRNFGWGYKDMDEGMEPFYYSCPLKFLDAAPELKPEWREKVRRWHKAQATKAALRKSLQIGTKIRLIDGLTVCGSPLTGVHEVKDTKPIAIYVGGMRIRVKPSHIAEVVS